MRLDPAADIWTTGNTGLYILELATGALRWITYEGQSTFPAWSPDSQMIVYQYRDETGKYSLAIARADDSCSVEAPGGEFMGSPAWPPDGCEIAFVYDGLIYVMDVVTVLGEDFLETGPRCP